MATNPVEPTSAGMRRTSSIRSAASRGVAGHEDLPPDLGGSRGVAGESSGPVGHIQEIDDGPLAEPGQVPVGGTRPTSGSAGAIRETDNGNPPDEHAGPIGAATANAIPSGQAAGGVNRPPVQPQGTASKEKEPDDKFGEEVSKGAKVWRMYRQEASTADEQMLKGWHDTLDVLLIFAGLFSAVSTAFLIESYKQLQPDNTDYMAKALYLALTSGNRTGLISASVELSRPGTDFKPPGSSRWINGLWFTSLVLSLAVSLLSILAKQWLEEYKIRVSAQPKDPRGWARRRSLFYHGLQQWQVPVVISFMPVVLHVSLFLFFAGLFLFLRQLDGAIALCVLCIAGPLLAFYILSNILPFAYAACPWYTAAARQVSDQFKSLTPPLYTMALHLFEYLSKRHSAGWIRRTYYDLINRRYKRLRPLDLLKPGHDILELGHDDELLDLLSLRWLIRESQSRETLATAVQAFGALPPWSITTYLSIMTSQETRKLIPRTADALNWIVTIGMGPIDIARYGRTLVYLSADPTDSSLVMYDFEKLLSTASILPNDGYDLAWLSRLSRATRSIISIPPDINLPNNLAAWLIEFKAQTHTSSPPFLSQSVLLALGILPVKTVRLMIHLFHVQRFDLLPLDQLEFFYTHLCSAANMQREQAGKNVPFACLAAWCRIYYSRDRFALDDADTVALVQNIDHSLLAYKGWTRLEPVGSHRTSEDLVLRYIAFDLQLPADESGASKLTRALYVLSSRFFAELIPGKGQRWYPEFDHALIKILQFFAQASRQPEIYYGSQLAFRYMLQDFMIELCYAFCLTDTELPVPSHHPPIVWHTESPCHPERDSPLCLLRPIDELERASGLRNTSSTEPEHETGSIWRTLVGLLLEAEAYDIQFLGIVDVLSTQLCALHRRGFAVSTLFNELFHRDEVEQWLLWDADRFKLKDKGDHHDSVKRKQIVNSLARIVQHCTEIDSGWWEAVCDDSEVDDGDYIIGVVNEAVKKLPRYCTHCPRRTDVRQPPATSAGGANTAGTGLGRVGALIRRLFAGAAVEASAEIELQIPAAHSLHDSDAAGGAGAEPETLGAGTQDPPDAAHGVADTAGVEPGPPHTGSQDFPAAAGGEVDTLERVIITVVPCHQESPADASG